MVSRADGKCGWKGFRQSYTGSIPAMPAPAGRTDRSISEGICGRSAPAEEGLDGALRFRYRILQPVERGPGVGGPLKRGLEACGGLRYRKGADCPCRALQR